MAGDILKLAVIVTVLLQAVAGQGGKPIANKILPLSNYTDVFFSDPSSAPSLIITPTSYDVEYGSTVLMTCVAYLGPASEDHSATTMTWLDPSGQQLLNDSESLVTIYTELQDYSGSVFLESILEICSLRQLGIGEYTCRVSNSVGQDAFNWTIGFSEELTPPQLIITPVDRSVNQGDTVVMACVASGFPEAEISWSRNGVLLDTNLSSLVNIYEQTITENTFNYTESILEICVFDVDSVGSFTCSATSDLGTVNSSSWTVDIFPSELICHFLLSFRRRSSRY